MYRNESLKANDIKYLLTIHNHTSYAEYQSGFYIQTGHITRVMIERTFFKHLPMPYNDCLDTIDTYRSFNRTFYDTVIHEHDSYRRQDCFNYCNHLEVLKQCNCSTSEIREPNYTFCHENIQSDQCENEIESNFFKIYLNDLFPLNFLL